MQDSLGAEFNEFMESMESEPPVSVRYHPKKWNAFRERVKNEQVPWCALGSYLPNRPSFTFDPLFHAGAYYVQEAGSMLIEPLVKNLLDEMNDPLVLDLCAAPGGKSTHLLSMMDGRGVLVSNEINPARNKVLQHNISKWGYANTVVIQNEPSEIAGTGLLFDLILADAPCSGEGLFRKDPDARNEWQPGSTESCARRQKKILESILPCLKPGGLLLYSTCTYAPEENDQQIEYLIRHEGFELILPEPPAGIMRTPFGWQAFPHRVQSEGFWCTLLKKPGLIPSGIKHNNGNTRSRIRKSKSPALDFLDNSSELAAFEFDQKTWIMPDRMDGLISALLKQSRIRKAGLQAGETKGKSFLPHIDIAWSIDCQVENRSFNIDYNQAIRYLQGESLNLLMDSDHETMVVQFESTNLGWIKRSGNHWSNHYPKEYRIRSRHIPG